MNIEMLVSTIDCINPIELYQRMNISSNALIINQTNTVSFEENVINQKRIKCYSFNERGIGLSRNSALMRSTGDICVMADDDMVYVENYEEIIMNGYKKYPDADMIVFNSLIKEKSGSRKPVKKNGRVKFYNCLKYGTVTFTFRRESILKNNITFSLIFGGGAKYGSGEDSKFIWDVIKKGMKVYSVTTLIAEVNNYESTWFDGFNQKYFFDRGALFKSLTPYFYYILILQFAIRKRKKIGENFTMFEMMKIMFKGAKDY